MISRWEENICTSVCVYKKEICRCEDNIKGGITLIYQICSITKYSIFYFVVLSVGLCLASGIRKESNSIINRNVRLDNLPGSSFPPLQIDLLLRNRYGRQKEF